MKRVEHVFEKLVELEKEKEQGLSAKELSETLNIDRANISRYLNKLYKENKVRKIEGRPVLFKSMNKEGVEKHWKERIENNSLDAIVGATGSLQVSIQQAKAAMLYPPRGLHTLILGETGVGKSMFAEMMFRFAKESKVIDNDAPFIIFNCADYADNPQLLISQIFGVNKGAYTGADKDKEGLLKKADKGILFLDEVHRLPPQGQEMLFMYIDKGYFRPLGETEKNIYVQVQIITATTEDPQSFLLKTFRRRIPMLIILPTLEERGIKDRYELIEGFIKEESKRVGKSIYVNKNSLCSFLLYDCPNNIGQLRSDIQLACAKAFLTFKSKDESYILINQSDVPNHVKKGLMKIKDYRNDVDRILRNKGDILRFYYKDEESSPIEGEYIENQYFYDLIEEKLETLKRKGLKENEINQILNIDIETYFEKYIGNLPRKFRKEEILKVVDIEIVELVEKVLEYAQKKLKREYDEKIYFGLSLHLHRSMERIKSGSKIYHPKLNLIRVNYADEFLVAMEAAKLLDSTFGIETPLDEIGYITLFLASKPYDLEGENNEKVGVLVIMHGNSTASSMVQVANSLVGVAHAIGLDMPLSMKTQKIYSVAKEYVIKLNQGKGVLIMVDMGSLTNFSDMIYEETGIITKTIDMTSTPMVIEACRKAVLGRELYDVYEFCKQDNIYKGKIINVEQKIKKDIIVSACFTGEGASEELKRIITEKMKNYNGFEIITVDILNRSEFLQKIKKLKEKYNILAIVGTIEIQVDDIPFISAVDILGGLGLERVEEIIKEEELFNRIENSLKAHIKEIDVEELIYNLRHTIEGIERSLNVFIAAEVKTGIVLHMSFLVHKLVKGEERPRFRDLNSFKSQYSREIDLIKNEVKILEVNYDFDIGYDELAYLCKMFIKNNTYKK